MSITVANPSARAQAQASAQVQLAKFFGDDETADTPEEMMIIKESRGNSAEARKYLANIPAELVQDIQTKTLAAMVLGSQVAFLNKIVHQGVVSEKDVEPLKHDCMASMQHLKKTRKTMAKRFTREAAAEEKKRVEAATRIQALIRGKAARAEMRSGGLREHGDEAKDGGKAPSMAPRIGQLSTSNAATTATKAGAPPATETRDAAPPASDCVVVGVTDAAAPAEV